MSIKNTVFMTDAFFETVLKAFYILYSGARSFAVRWSEIKDVYQSSSQVERFKWGADNRAMPSVSELTCDDPQHE